MLRDSKPTYQPPNSSSLDVSTNLEVDSILKFIDENISGFYEYYISRNDSDKENRISEFLISHFQISIHEQGGFLPYYFIKNPTQAVSTRETDIGVKALTRSAKNTIIEFEAKRFSESSNNKEYVCGERGGIERFKKDLHSSHLVVCGMFGYVQSGTAQEWIGKVNGWIGEKQKNNQDSTIDWTTDQEQLISNNTFPRVEKLFSKHLRKQSNDFISLWHYLIELK